MAQQIFDQYAPLAKVSVNETIPVVAAIAQTRDGKDELLHGTVPFVPAGDLYVPVSAANRLPVEATLTGHDVEPINVQPSGQIVEEVLISSPQQVAPGAELTFNVDFSGFTHFSLYVAKSGSVGSDEGYYVVEYVPRSTQYLMAESLEHRQPLFATTEIRKFAGPFQANSPRAALYLRNLSDTVIEPWAMILFKWGVS